MFYSRMLNCLKNYESNQENVLILSKCLDAMNFILKQDESDAIKKSLVYNQGVEYLFGALIMIRIAFIYNVSPFQIWLTVF